jgi:hypothetical protein
MDPLGPDLARNAVVVHTLVDVPNVAPRGLVSRRHPDGFGRQRPGRCLNAPRRPHRGVADDGVDLSVTAGAARAVEIVRGIHSDDMVGVIGDLQTPGPCGVRKGTYATSTFSQFGVRTTGFGGAGEPGATPPTVTWTVGGMPS